MVQLCNPQDLMNYSDYLKNTLFKEQIKQTEWRLVYFLICSYESFDFLSNLVEVFVVLLCI